MTPRKTVRAADRGPDWKAGGTTPDPTCGLRYPLNALVSFHYFQRVNVGRLAQGGLRLVGDSGAFSALNLGTPIDADAYVAWCHRWRDSLAWCAGLDVIGDADATWTNWQTMRRTGIEFVPTIHYGEDPRTLDRYADAGVDYVGLGGMVARKSEPERLLRWCVQVMRYARDTHPGMRFHGWGVSHPRLLHALPWYSTDSSGWGGSYRFARVQLFDQSTGRMVGWTLDGQLPDHTKRDLIRSYGVDPATLRTSSPNNRRAIIRLSAASYQRYEDHLRRRVTVTPPSWGLRPAYAQTGPHLHLADTDQHNLGSLRHPAHTLGMTDPEPGPQLHLAQGDSTTDVRHLTNDLDLTPPMPPRRTP